jgi:long-chain acyl-CoA synthetase
MLPGMNIISAIRGRVAPTAVALVQGTQQLTYAELFARVDAVRMTLPEAGQRLRIGVTYPSGMHYIPLAMAVLAAGHCFVPIPDELAVSEKADLIRTTALHGIISAAADGGFIYTALQTVEPSFSEAGFHALNPAFIRFSSGTTARAKGVVLSHESLLERITAANEGLCICPGDRILWTLPMAHHFAVSIVLYLYHGATTIVEEQHLGAELLAAGEKHGATVMYGSPMHYRQLSAVAPEGQQSWPTLRLAVSTAAALDGATAALFAQRFCQPLIQGLGIIEVGLPLLNLAPPVQALEAIGPTLPAYQARLDAPDADGIGQLMLRGPGMFDAYLQPWASRAEVVDAEGWFATGDLAQCDAEGRYTLKGRSKTVINVGGMKVFPEEVEQVLQQHPGVQRALVSSRAHPLYGEVPVAQFEPTVSVLPNVVTPAELREHCRQQLASYKVPLTFTAVAALPTTASGKLCRHT